MLPGTHGGDPFSALRVVTLLARIERGEIDPSTVITHVLPLERINDAFDLMHAGESIRSVVVY